MKYMDQVLEAYGFSAGDCKVKSFGSGLINRTWTVTHGNDQYILQKINDSIFKTPEDIAWNIDLIDEYLRENFPDYFFTGPVRTVEGKGMFVQEGEGFYRMFEFVPGSHSIDVVENPDQAYEAARQFGKFTRLLSGLDCEELKITLPSFHDLTLRYEQFLDALENGDKGRIKESATLIEQLREQSGIADEYVKIKSSPDFRQRVTHHDTKISNVLFDSSDKAICVIDLDTVMPGYFISDLGDMMRTYLSPVSEEEKDFSKIVIRDEFYKALVKGYGEEMGGELSDVERAHFFYSGTFMIYMQALRFLTDHLNNDRYYGARYEGHNLVRAQNQVTLLQRLLEKKDVLSAF
jgi:Ser/Thr protein kinase RdoA (MazF antagonist)